MTYTFDIWYMILLYTLKVHHIKMQFFMIMLDNKPHDNVDEVKSLFFDMYFKKEYPSTMLKQFSWEDTQQGEVYWERVYKYCVQLESMTLRAVRKRMGYKPTI